MPALLDSERLLMVLKAASADRALFGAFEVLDTLDGRPSTMQATALPAAAENQCVYGMAASTPADMQVGRQAGSASHRISVCISRGV